MNEALQIKWFTWGYMLMDSRWWPYVALKLPGRRFEYVMHRDRQCWCMQAVLWVRGKGCHMIFNPTGEP